jgi:hypothetical protein
MERRYVAIDGLAMATSRRPAPVRRSSRGEACREGLRRKASTRWIPRWSGTSILLTQRMVTSPEPTELVTDFRAAAYAAIDA